MHLSNYPGQALKGVLMYSEEEYSFRFNVDSVAELAARVGGTGQSSVSIGTLQLEVASGSGVVLYAWGLHPRTQWKNGNVSAPEAKPGVVRLDANFDAGVSISRAPVGGWTTVFDPTTGWIRVAEDESQDDDLTVEVASGVVLGERRGKLCSIWLHPLID
ncbi:hypothetical protein GCM10009744_14950 [Kribbella alba]|uniref:Uncharacterized protein n=1 Tax=Kribbella alba TaxID=190197 RepID=A0ABN2F3I4_9ACTN